MEVEFESPEQLAAFQRMQASHPDALVRLLDQGERLQDRVKALEARPKCEHGTWSAECTRCLAGRVHGWATADMWRKGASGPGTTKVDMRFQAHCIATECARVLKIRAPPDFEGFGADQRGEEEEMNHESKNNP